MDRAYRGEPVQEGREGMGAAPDLPLRKDEMGGRRDLVVGPAGEQASRFLLLKGQCAKAS